MLSSAVSGQWLTGYNNRIKITIPSSQILGSIPHTNFPVLINTARNELRDYSSGGYVASANGWDIVFSENHMTTLDHQLEYYNNNTGELVAWVRIPMLDPGTSYEFYIYFGSIWLDSDLSTSNTWSSDYVSVYHLHDDFLDATSSTNDGTNHGSFNAEGKIADAQEFNGTSHYIDLDNPSEFNFSTGNWTISAWIKTTDNFQNNIFSNGGDDVGGIRYVLASSETGSAGTAVLTTDDNYYKYQAISAGGITDDGNWHYIVGKRDGTNIFIYHDSGGPEDMTNIAAGAGYDLSGTSQKNALIGAGFSQQYGNIIKYFYGSIDEVRVQRVARNTGWIQTEYNNQNSPSTFCQFGSLEIPNDDPCGAISLIVEDQCGENTIFASNVPATSGSYNPGCYWNAGTDSDVWFRFTIPSSGQVKVEGIESSLVDGGMAFYSGQDCNSLTYLDCVDDLPGMETYIISGEPGDKIWVQIWGWDGGTGRFGICVTDYPPIPDEPCDAVLLPVNNTCINSTFDNTNATSSSVPDPDFCIGQDSYRPFPEIWSSRDIWFKFIVPASGQVTVEGTQNGGMEDGVLAIYRGSCSSLTLVDCDDDSKEGPGGMPIVNLSGQVPGDTLWIRFWGYINETGSFDICVHDPSCSAIIVDAGDDRLICAGETVTLGGTPTATGWTGTVTYYWTPATGLDDPTSPNPEATILSNTIYTVYVSDDNGCYASDIVNISIKDDDADPVLLCLEDQNISTNAGCTYEVQGTELDLISVIDNCILVDTTYQVSGVTNIPETSSRSLQGVVLGTGTSIVTWRVYDGLGNFGQCSFSVTVADEVDPTVTSCPADIEVSNDPGDCFAIVNYAEPVFEDNCDGAGLSGIRTQGPASGSSFPIGVTIITYEYSDAGGNGPVECTFTVTVNDDEDPIINCATPAASYSTNEGECYYTVPGNGLDPVLTDDNCGIASVLNDFNGGSTLAGEQFPVGITPVTWTITDVNGRTADCQYNIEVIDNQDPTINCATPEASYNADPGECTYTVPGTDLDPVSVDDDCGIASVENNFNGTSSLEGAEFPVGVTPVTWTITDINGHTAECGYNIEVIDNQDPVITCASPEDSYSTDPGECNYTVPDNGLDPIYTDDNCAIFSVINNFNGTSTLEDAIFPVGITVVVWTITDVNGRVADCQYDIEVIDNQDPVITCATPEASYNADPGECYYTVPDTDLDPVLLDDDCGIASVVNDFNGTSTLEGAEFPVGITPVTWTITDINGHNAECGYNIEVIDNQDPVVTCASPEVSYNMDPGECSYTVPDTGLDPVLVDDNCGITSVVNNFNGTSSLENAEFPVGVTTVTWTITDVNGRTADCQYDIEVIDNQQPVITCPDPAVSYNTNIGKCFYKVPGTSLDPVLTEDNCGIASVENDFNGSSTLAGAEFPVGLTTVTWTITDNNGLTNQCSYDIEVIDIQDPRITCAIPEENYDADEGECYYTVPGTGLDPTFIYDNCGIASVENDINGTATLEGEQFPVGLTTVVWTITDIYGLTDNCQYDIEVVDTEAPVITCAIPPAVYYLDADESYIEINDSSLDPTLTDDNCNISTVENDFNGGTTLNGAQFLVGITTVTWTVTDVHDNINTCEQIINVEDTISPTFTQPADITIYKDEDCNYDASLTVTGDVTDEADNCDTSLDAGYGDTVLAGSCEGEEIINRLWSLTDDCGNTTTHMQVITIMDTISPTFTAPFDTIICRMLDCSYDISLDITGDVTDEADNCDDSLDAVYTDDESGALDCSNLGLVIRTWTLTDDCGNTTTHAQYIWIEPVINLSAEGDTLCDGDQTNILVESLNTTYNGIRYTWTVADNPNVEGEQNSTGDGQMIGTAIVNTLDNTTDIAQLVQYILTPWTINNSGDNECIGNQITVDIWVNPTPRVIPVVSEDRICSEDETEVEITSPTVMTHGELKFDYIVHFSGSPGDLTGDNNPQTGLDESHIINFPYTNTSDTVQSVYYSILPRSEGTGCAPGLRDTAEIKVHPEPMQDLYVSQHLTCDSNFDMELTVEVAKGTGPYDITWSGGPATFIPEDWHNELVVYDLRGGIYSVTVTDNLGCVTFDLEGEYEVSPDPAFYPLLKAPLNQFHISCHGGEDGVIEFQCWDGENFPYTYWIVKNEEDTVYTDVLTSASEIDFITNLGEGFYDYILLDDNGCFFNSSVPIEIVAPEPIEAEYSLSEYGEYNISCKGYDDGWINVESVTGGNGSYEYFWYTDDGPVSGDNTLDHLSGIRADTFYIDITDVMGCVMTDTIILTEPDGITPGEHDISLYQGGFNISCNGESDGYINLEFEGGSGGYTYLWSGPAGSELQLYERNQSGLIAGDYSVVVTDANNCEMPLEFTLTEPEVLEIIFETSLTYDGAYNIECNGGTGQLDITVSGGSITGYTFEWSSRDGSGLSQGMEDQDGLTAGTYVVKVTDLNGCELTDSIELSEPPQLIVESEKTDITCESPGMDNGTITLTVQGGAGEPYTYLWSNGSTDRDLTGLSEGWYDVIVRDLYGCEAYDTLYISLPPPLELQKDTSNYNGYGVSCYNSGDAYININMTSGEPPYTFSWTGPDGYTSSESSINNLTAGVYVLTVEDVNYCTVTDTTIFIQPDTLIINLDISESIDGAYNISCYGDNSGSIEVLPENYVGDVEYFWTDGYMGSARTNLPAGTYGVMIVDENYCNADTVITLTQPDALVITAEIVQPYCKDMPDGEILAEASGGIPGYSYLWYDNTSSPQKVNIAAGEYPLTVTDANGCSITDTIVVTSEQEVCITIPNAISPNGDNINDVWNIEMIQLYPEAEIKIFNRWGEIVWASEKGYPEPWDGTSNGRKLPVDSYHYIINLHDGTKPVIGDVTIIR